MASPKGNYPWGSLGAVLVTTEILRRAGTDTRNDSDKAVERAGNWLVTVNQNNPSGDDGWIPHLLDYLLSNYNWPVGSLREGKNMAFTGWTHAGRTTGSVLPPTPEPPPVDPCKAERDAVVKAQQALDAARVKLMQCEAAL